MAALTVALSGLVANPIFVLRHPPDFAAGGTITFEVLEVDAEGLKAILNRPTTFALDGRSFSGSLTHLGKNISTHPGLALLREKPTLRGAITVFPVSSSSRQ
jgi:hypothetical protein